ncbi:MAG: D-glycero-beta-D-manno-heptose 1-phosphate adenylyltransferase [bacterium]|nr:D-glycero-beta-D-manno-heptose 1-phosphate adenylyltransferase [bacterium]
MNHTYLKIKRREELHPVIVSLQKQGKKIVFTNGCFDIIHLGHVRLLQEARAQGDKLIIAINTDDSVRGLKGNARPLLEEQDRAEMLAALECVDFVTFFAEPTPLETILILHPDVLVKGADYTLDEIVGKKEVLAYGGKVLAIPLTPGYSTTALIEKIKKITQISEK